ADKDWLIVVCFFMVSPSLSLAFYKNATVAHRRLGLGESIQLQWGRKQNGTLGAVLSFMPGWGY
ncbi:hypothetical protein PUN49_26565, partial [Pseudomonas extremaustralis]|uniref:hypothetical protein n=1 Tax=Pseudomonas extremaustralis TaxID=359110 RepID=UPI00240FD9AF